MMSRRGFAGGVGALALSGAGVAGFRAQAARSGLAVDTRVAVAFNTPVAMTVAAGSEHELSEALTAAFAALRAVERASSVYRSDSELSRLNSDGVLNAPSDHLRVLLSFARTLAAQTDGRFDPTVQPLWDHWAEATRLGVRPTRESLKPVLARVDWRKIHIAERRIEYSSRDTAVTLNAINQGYAADVVMDVLRQHGIGNALIDTGEFGAQGRHPQGRAWRLGVRDPRRASGIALTLDPFRQFSATSGDYKTYFSPDFADHHIFIPATGYSPPHWSSITVLAQSGLVADGLSTALFTMAPDECNNLLLAYPSASAFCIDKAGDKIWMGRSA